MVRRLFLFVLALVLVGCVAERDRVASTPPDSVQNAVETAIQDLDAMRESLAATIDTPSVNQQTFARVCKPVGRRAQRMAKERGWTVQQLAQKYRNPAHAPDSEADSVHVQFGQNPEQTAAWVRTVRDDARGWRYFRRITVQPSCLACHGPKDQRPEFVKQTYPNDRAYGFDVGDLRGLYAVFVADSTMTPDSGSLRP